VRSKEFGTRALHLSVIIVLLLAPPFSWHPDSSLLGEPVSIDSSGFLQEPNSSDFQSSSLPNPVVVLDTELSIINTPQALQGLNLFVVVRSNKTTGAKDLFLLITDMEGNVEKQKYLGSQALVANVPAEFINSTTILAGDDEGAFLWNIYTDETEHLGFSGHHEYEYNAVNHTVFTLRSYVKSINDTDYLYGKIMEFVMDGNSIWSKDTRDFISPYQWCPYEDLIGDAVDLIHSNTVFFDENENTIYFNGRNVNTFYKIDHATGEVIWGLGEYGNFTLYDINGVERSNLFYHAHAVERIDENRFIVFDNDYHNQTDPDSRSSAIREIVINETAMTANVSWQWVSPETYWSVRWGDADRLANCNRLGTFGTETHVNTTLGPRLVEIDDEGTVVWGMDFGFHPDYFYGIYRAERFCYSPILSSPSDLEILEGTAASVSWNAWYNFRPKREINGTYEILLDGASFESGQIQYDRYWRKRQLTAQLGVLPAGIHNLTLIASDEAGHNSSDSVTVNVAGFWLERAGPEIIEIGEEYHTLTWTGDTLSPLQCEVRVDSQLLESFEWTGEDFGLDLSILEPGNREIEVEMTNSSGQVHYEHFEVTVYPAEPPIVTSTPSDLAISWNETPVLSWNLEDNRPSEWSIYIDGTPHTTDIWEESPFTLDWLLPVLDEGFHNITLTIHDKAGHQAIDTIWIEVDPPSPPVISATPYPTTIIWGRDDVTFDWEVHGGQEYELWRNNTLKESGPLETTDLSVPIESWQAERWRPGIYNLTLVVSDTVSRVSQTTWIHIILDPGDPYADDVVNDFSGWFLFGDNALGAPDGEYARIYLDYANGFMTLDMGDSEEVVNEDGNDFAVISESGECRVSVATSLTDAFTSLGRSGGNTSYDLQDFGLEGFRYVRVEFYSGEEVLLDAIVGYNVNVPLGDTIPPVIYEVEDFSAYDNVPSVSITWTATDDAPWSYVILLNDTLVSSGHWNGSEITYFLAANVNASWNVTLILEDLMGNTASSSVVIEIKPLLASIWENPWITLGLVSVSGAAVLALAFGLRRMKRNS
jgi:hypothetical protein